MVLQSWIIGYLKMFKISSEVTKSMENTIENWGIELTAGDKSLTNVKIQRKNFQGDTPSQLIFIVAMMPLCHILLFTDTNF